MILPLIRDTTRGGSYAETQLHSRDHLDPKPHPWNLASLRWCTKTSYRILHRRADNRTRTLGDTCVGDRHTTRRHGLPFPLPRGPLDREWSNCLPRIQHEIRARHRNLHRHTVLRPTGDYRQYHHYNFVLEGKTARETC